MDFQIIRSRRKTLCLEIKSGEVIIRAPYRMKDSEIENFIRQKESWIQKQLSRTASEESVQKLSSQEIQLLKQKASETIPERVRYYADILGISLGKITIRKQKTRWGSYSTKGNLNFNCLLMLTPPEVIDSVVVHELCHRKYMNHSDDFYRMVLRVFPDYPQCDKWLRQNGRAIMARCR